MFLNRGSAEPWGSVGISQGFRGHIQWIHSNLKLLMYLFNLGVNSPLERSEMGEIGHYDIISDEKLFQVVAVLSFKSTFTAEGFRKQNLIV